MILPTQMLPFLGFSPCFVMGFFIPRNEREKRAEAEKENELLKKLLIGRGV